MLALLVPAALLLLLLAELLVRVQPYRRYYFQ